MPALQHDAVRVAVGGAYTSFKVFLHEVMHSICSHTSLEKTEHIALLNFKQARKYYYFHVPQEKRTWNISEH